MSEPIVNIDLKQIKAPSLTSTKYGKDIREQFENIDENFRRVSNHDYVKGKSGANINVIDLPLYEDDQFTDLGITLLNDLTESNINWNDTLTWDYNTWIKQGPGLGIGNKFFPVVYTDETGIEHMICFYDYMFQNSNITVFYTLVDVEQEDIDSNRHYICSPQVYTFLDQRYANVEELGGINEANFYGLEDMSCLLTLKYTNNDPTFARVNLFPTLYYESTDIVSSDDSDDVVREGSFKWKIYGNKTGIRAQGPKGDNGSSMSLWIVRTQKIELAPYLPNPFPVPVMEVAVLTDNGWKWTSISDLSQDQKPSTGDACLVLANIVDENSDDSDDTQVIADAFVSPAYMSGNNVYVIINQYNSINGNSALNSLLGQLNQIHEGSLLGGLFIPYYDKSGAHFLFHEDQNSIHVLHLQPQIPNIGTTLDVSEPTNNSYDENSKLDVRYNEINLQSEGGIINLEKGVEIAVNSNGDETISLNSSSDINIVAENQTRISSSTTSIYGDEVDLQGEGGYVNINDESVEISTNTQLQEENLININSEKIEVAANLQGSDIEIKSDNNTTLVSYSGNINLNTNHGLVKSNSPVTAEVNRIANVYLGCPIGTVVMWAGTEDEIPDDWLLCNGRSIIASQAAAQADLKDEKYDNLYRILGGPSSGIKAIPDLIQRFPLGAKNDTNWGSKHYNTTLGHTGGEVDHTLSVDEMPSHQHELKLTAGTSGSETGLNSTNNTTYIGDTSPCRPAGSSYAHNNIPSYYAINFIIKYQ